MDREQNEHKRLREPSSSRKRSFATIGAALESSAEHDDAMPRERTPATPTAIDSLLDSLLSSLAREVAATYISSNPEEPNS